MSFVNKITSTINSIASGISGSTININGKSVTVGEKIADGGYGFIYRATDSSGKVYALKALQAPDEDHYQDILREYEIQKRCADHPNIVNVYGMTSHPQTRQATILMEFCTDDLIKHMNAAFKQGFDDHTIVEVFTQVCEAVNHIHTLDPPVIHRDLKPENVLRNNGKWKLCDFGSATTRVYTLKTNQERNEASDDLEKNTTALYRAPEMCDLYRRQPINTKADVWALGCILFKLCTFKDAFSDGSNLQILNVKYQWPQNKNVNQKFKDIVKYIFNTNPTNRPSARDVLGELYKQFPEWVDSKWQQESTSNSQAAEPFNPFGSPQSKPPQQTQNQQPFDPFGNSGGQQAVRGPPRKQQEEFNPFGNSASQPIQNSPSRKQPPQQSAFPHRSPQEPFNPFGDASNEKPSAFNPFGNSSNEQPSTFNPFESNNSNNNLIDSYDNNNNDDGDGGTFDPFAQLTAKPQQQQLKSSSQDLFDGQPPSGDGASAPFNPFGDSSQPVEMTFNPFEISNNTASNPQQAPPAPVHKPPHLGNSDPFGAGVPSKSYGSTDDGISLLGGEKLANDSFDSSADFSSFGQPHITDQVKNQSHPSSSLLDSGGFSDMTKLSSSISKIDPRRALKDPDGLATEILSLKSESEISDALYSISNSLKPEESLNFFLHLLHQSGTNGSKIAAIIPVQQTQQSSKNQQITPLSALTNLLASRKSFMNTFPMFEGNFALTNFLRANRANPVPIGQPPICVDAVKSLLEHIDLAIALMRCAPNEDAAEEAYESYQVTAFLLARLKVAKVKEGYTVSTAIPRFRNQHGQLKRAFSNVNLQIRFPPEPFDFNDDNFLKRIRPPQSKV